MTKLFIDTNVFVDVFLERKEFIFSSGNIVELSSEKFVRGATSASSMLNLYFIIKKLKDKTKAKKALTQLSEIVDVVAVDEKIIFSALESDFSDVEDAVQYQCAKKMDADFIITRNTKDFKNSKIPVLTPEQFLAKIKK